MLGSLDPRHGQKPLPPRETGDPVAGNAVQTVERARELSSESRRRIGVVGEIDREQHGIAEVARLRCRPDRRFEGVDHVVARFDGASGFSAPSNGRVVGGAGSRKRWWEMARENMSAGQARRSVFGTPGGP